MTPLCTRIYTHPFFEATPPGAAPGPPVKNRVPVFATSGGVTNIMNFDLTKTKTRTNATLNGSPGTHSDTALSLKRTEQYVGEETLHIRKAGCWHLKPVYIKVLK